MINIEKVQQHEIVMEYYDDFAKVLMENHTPEIHHGNFICYSHVKCWILKKRQKNKCIYLLPGCEMCHNKRKNFNYFIEDGVQKCSRCFKLPKRRSL